MPVTMVIDTGFGDSGKAKLVEYLAMTDGIRHVVGGGIGPGSAMHRFLDSDDAEIRLRQVPPGVLSPAATMYLGPGTLVDLRLLADEVAALNRHHVRDRLVVDRRCGMVEPDHSAAERASTLGGLGLHWDNGCAAARSTYLLRQIGRLADAPDPPCATGDVVTLLNGISASHDVLIGADDGPEYDLYTSDHYPYTLSDGCSVAAVLARTGLAWSHLRRVIGVVNMMPTTVLPVPLAHELGPDQLKARNLSSRGLVTGLPRRVAACPDLTQLKRFIQNQRPSELALGRADMFDSAASAVTRAADLPRSVRDWVVRIEDTAEVPVTYVSTGPGVRHCTRLPG